MVTVVKPGVSSRLDTLWHNVWVGCVALLRGCHHLAAGHYLDTQPKVGFTEICFPEEVATSVRLLPHYVSPMQPVPVTTQSTGNFAAPSWVLRSSGQWWAFELYTHLTGGASFKSGSAFLSGLQSLFASLWRVNPPIISANGSKN